MLCTWGVQSSTDATMQLGVCRQAIHISNLCQWLLFIIQWECPGNWQGDQPVVRSFGFRQLCWEVW